MEFLRALALALCMCLPFTVPIQAQTPGPRSGASPPLASASPPRPPPASSPVYASAPPPSEGVPPPKVFSYPPTQAAASPKAAPSPSPPPAVSPAAASPPPPAYNATPLGPTAAPAPQGPGWLSHGYNDQNRRWAEQETTISPATAPGMQLRWKFPTGGDVTCTPAVYKGVVYVPDWAGNLFAIDHATGKTVWKKTFSGDYGFPAKTFSRATPAVGRFADSATLKQEVLVVGISQPGVVMAVSLTDGTPVWNTTVEYHPLAKIIGGATVSWGAVYVGVSSNEEAEAANPSYPCCTFIGSVAKLDLETGQMYWKQYILPQNQGYAGGAMWGANPAVDNTRGEVYAGTGNMYLRPPAVQECVNANPNRTAPDPCIFPGNHQEAVIALGTWDGSYNWSTSLDPVDAWTVACTTGQYNPNCPPNPGPDFDFGMNPLLLTIQDPRQGKEGQQVDVAIIGQKSGIIYALDRDSGSIVWIIQAGPSGSLGGSSWGMASDGLRVYLGNMNADNKEFYLSTLNKTVTTGAWIALNASTGQPIWYFPDSNANPSWAMMPAVANGVVFVGSADPQGHVYALNAETGEALWEFAAGATVYGGVAIDSGCIYFGYGYGAFSSAFKTTGGGPQNIYAFCADTNQTKTSFNQTGTNQTTTAQSPQTAQSPWTAPGPNAVTPPQNQSTQAQSEALPSSGANLQATGTPGAPKGASSRWTAVLPLQAVLAAALVGLFL